jgi:hypothetical protein
MELKQPVIVAQALAPLAAGAIMDRFDPRWVWYVCAISMVGFYALHVRARERLIEKQAPEIPDLEERN